MSVWVAAGVIWAFGLILFIVSFAGYRERIRWYEQYDREHPGVAEKIGMKPRSKNG